VKIPAVQKASDLHKQAQPFGRTAFLDAFPTVHDIEVRWRRQVLGSGPKGSGTWHIVRGVALGEFVDCPDGSCLGGGFCIGAVIRDMVSMSSRLHSGRVRCRGRLNLPENVRRCRLCMNVYKFDVRITYKHELLEQKPPSTPAPVESGVQPTTGAQ
jgi:hypothetical protein